MIIKIIFTKHILIQGSFFLEILWVKNIKYDNIVINNLYLFYRSHETCSIKLGILESTHSCYQLILSVIDRDRTVYDFSLYFKLNFISKIVSHLISIYQSKSDDCVKAWILIHFHKISVTFRRLYIWIL